MKLRAALWVTVAVVTAFIAMESSVVAGVAPENVAIVVNGNSEASKLITEEYVRLLERFDLAALGDNQPETIHIAPADHFDAAGDVCQTSCRCVLEPESMRSSCC